MSCDDGATSDADCSISPISESSFQHDGQLGGLSYGATSSLILYILPVPVMQIEFLGGPSLGFKAYLDFAADAASDIECQSGQMVEAPMMAPVPSNNAIKATVNLGIQITVSAEIKIGFSSSTTIYHKKFPSKAIFAKKLPIVTGCFTIAGNIDSWREVRGLTPFVVNRAMHYRTAGPVVLHGVAIPHAALQNVGTTPGTIYIGTIMQNGCLPEAPERQDVTMQLTANHLPFTLFYGGSTVWHSTDPQTGVSTGTCVFQSGWSFGLGRPGFNTCALPSLTLTFRALSRALFPL